MGAIFCRANGRYGTSNHQLLRLTVASLSLPQKRKPGSDGEGYTRHTSKRFAYSRSPYSAVKLPMPRRLDQTDQAVRRKLADTECLAEPTSRHKDSDAPFGAFFFG